MKINRSIKITLLTAFFVSGLLVTLLFFGILQLNNPNENRFPIRGIDVSKYQGEIDWTELKKNKIRFVFIKATEGGNFRDAQFFDNWNESKKAGLIRGAYHFFTFCRTGREQAQNFIATVPVEEETLPPVIDLEFGGNCAVIPEKEFLLKELNDFISEIENQYHQQPILYLKYDSYETYIKGEFENFHIWIQDRFFYPELSVKRNWLFWQYSSRGWISGITTYVDLNVFNGTEQDFNRIIKTATFNTDAR